MPLPREVASAAGARLGADLTQVRLHGGGAATEAARGVAARAFTLADNVVFGELEYRPQTRAGRHLIAHEIVHAAHHSNDRVVRRAPDRPKGVVKMHFDGRDLIVYDGGKEKFRFGAESGRPILLHSKDARACGGDPRTDTYLNDKRYVGVKDLGPIPEGTYRFSPKALQRFSFGEELSLVLHHNKPVQTKAGVVTGGDWGAGRVALHKVGRVREGPCGKANTRTAFYLHGGWAGGSSGCIDIGLNFSTLADFLADYKRDVRLTVAYEHQPPSVGALTGFTGALAYNSFDAALLPRLSLGTETEGGDTRLLVVPQVDAVLRWAGGALRAGVRLEVPVRNKDEFVRLGLGGGLDFRLFRALYGQIYGGYSFALTDPKKTSQGGFVGGGLQYDLGRVQLGLLYDHLWAAGATNPDAHRVLAQLGIRFF